MKFCIFLSGLILAAGTAGAECLSGTLEAASGFDCKSEPGACRATFDLGVPASRETYEALRREIATCPGLVAAEQDQGVNHPDFYDAWAYTLPDGAMTLSIKDKSALGKTFVVLRRLPQG